MKEENKPTTKIQVPAPRANTLAIAKRIDEIASGAVELFKEAGSFEAELSVAQAMNDLRLALTNEVMAPVMALMNTDLGFRTDRDPKQTDTKTGKPLEPYPVEVVRECFVESKLRGFHTIGNEWNIISGRFYACKNGLRRKVTTHPGVTDFKDRYDVPRVAGEKGAIVKASASWKKDGVADSIECEIPVRVNFGMGSDAILGKGERKLLRRVHDRLSGVITPEGDVSDAELEGAKPITPRPTFGTAETTATVPPAATPEGTNLA